MIRTNKSPKVCIRCITYNHEAYIRDCLEGFVMQKTNFPYIAIVHDDASTDGTASIIREYAERYPDIIKPIYEVENQYSKPGNLLGKLMNKACLETGAPYIAICEGDDYWTDPLKLQKQVDFLESHPDYSLVFANVRLHYENGLSNETFPLEDRTYNPIELYECQLIATPTMLYRSEVLKNRNYLMLSSIKRIVMGDLTIYMVASTIGKIYGSKEVVGGYRRLSTGATNYLFQRPYLYFRNRRKIAIKTTLGRAAAKIDSRRFSFYFPWALRHPLIHFPDNICFAWQLLWLNPIACIQELGSSLRRFNSKLWRRFHN